MNKAQEDKEISLPPDFKDLPLREREQILNELKREYDALQRQERLSPLVTSLYFVQN